MFILELSKEAVYRAWLHTVEVIAATNYADLHGLILETSKKVGEITKKMQILFLLND